jgi:excisionase family DNA binding protein
MAQEKLLTIRDVSLFLGITEKEVIELAESGQIPAYKVGGVYLRFKREQVEDFKRRSGRFFKAKSSASGYSLKERFSDFIYFNDFYILSGLIILLMLVIIFRSYQ